MVILGESQHYKIPTSYDNLKRTSPSFR